MRAFLCGIKKQALTKFEHQGWNTVCFWRAQSLRRGGSGKPSSHHQPLIRRRNSLLLRLPVTFSTVIEFSYRFCTGATVNLCRLPSGSEDENSTGDQCQFPAILSRSCVPRTVQAERRLYPGSRRSLIYSLRRAGRKSARMAALRPHFEFGLLP